MKYSINLFDSALIPKEPWLHVRNIGLVLLAVIFIVVIIRAVLLILVMRLDVDLQAALQNQNQQQIEMARLSAEVAELRVNPVKQLRAERLRMDARGKDFALEQFSQLQGIETQNYANLLTELAKAQVNGIWLTALKEENGDLSLTGLATTPELVPKWLQTFANYDLLQARRFGRIQMSQADGRSVQFTISGDGFNVRPDRGATEEINGTLDTLRDEEAVIYD